MIDAIYESLLREQECNTINEDTVCFSYNGNKSIYVFVDIDPGRNFGENDAYFKCLKYSDDLGTTNPARIAFKSARYIIHNKKSRNQFTLNPKQKKVLNSILREYNPRYKCTNWVRAIRLFNSQVEGKYGEKYKLSEDLEIPDYTELPN